MAYLGNKDGPRESEILDRLGPAYFGCSIEGLEEDINHHRYAESRGEVVPVHVDEAGRPYVEFSSPIPGRVQRFVLEEHGYHLRGKIETFSIEEKTIWAQRTGERTNSPSA